MIQRTFETFRNLEAAGKIKQGSAPRVAVAAVLESGCATFAKAYFGIEDYSHAASVVESEKAGAEMQGRLNEAMLSDLGKTRSVLREAHATTDFPLILQNLRARILREDYQPSDSVLPGLAASRPVSDFKLIRGMKIEGIGDLTEQAEGESVDYTTFDYTTDAYSIVMLSRAMKLTWQIIKNDDIGLWTRGMTELGKAARRARAVACVRAIREGLTQTTLPDVGVGGPTIPRLEAAYQYQAERTREIEGEERPAPRMINGIIVPPVHKMAATASLNSTEIHVNGDREGTANPVAGLGTLYEDLILGEFLGRDWIAFNKGVPFLELAVLDDFQGGPRTLTKLPDVVEDPRFGSFDDLTSAIKVMDACGAKVISPEDAIRVKGA